jgi:HNH endonuclease
LAVSVLSSFVPQIIENAKQGISEKSVGVLFSWTLTHFTPAFSVIGPVFRTRKNLQNYVIAKTGISKRGAGYDSSSEITRIALDKTNSEWKAWVSAHDEFPIDEFRLDNILMRVLYKFILARDRKRCALCQTIADLTIHHIIQKRRNLISSPPFGRSVPTNLITLCRSCHSIFDPSILV